MRRRTRTVLLAGSGVLVVAAGAAAAIGVGGADARQPARSTLPPATATVERTTLTNTETVDGTLGYGDPTIVKASGGGIVTGLSPLGSILKRGKALYEVDEDPIVLLYGSTPLYRTLAPGLSGGDVALLEKNLSALGYDGFTVDGEYTSATADAVARWQEDLGRPETGTVAVGQVVVAPGEARVSEHKVTVGDQAGGPVLAYTGTTRMVTVALEVDKQDLVKKGVAATVELPSGAQVAGAVAGVGTVATTTTADNQETTTVEVTVTVKDQKALGTLDQAPVDVKLRADQRENVLAVPINALVALSEGGYGVQLVEGDSTHYVAVDTGMFAGGKVEISGDGVVEGATVGVPK